MGSSLKPPGAFVMFARHQLPEISLSYFNRVPGRMPGTKYFYYYLPFQTSEPLNGPGTSPG
jgi:hypothetical protein